MSLIKVEGITKQYSLGNQTVDALRGISFDINQGEFIAIMGPSGSGKSTLMNIIGCLDTPTQGKYFLNQQEVSTFKGDELAKIRNKEIGFVFQTFHLLARNTALDNVMLPLKYAGFDKAKQLNRAKSVLLQVDLESRMEHQPSELSGGEQQRVAIARALVNKPSILFADEPTGNLDSQTGNEVIKLFKDLHDQGQTIILITHENEIASVAQRTIFIKDGLIESDTQNK